MRSGREETNLSSSDQMREVSRALACRHYDRAFVLVSQFVPPAIAAAFLIWSGVPVGELPRDAARAILLRLQATAAAT